MLTQTLNPWSSNFFGADLNMALVICILTFSLCICMAVLPSVPTTRRFLTCAAWEMSQETAG